MLQQSITKGRLSTMLDSWLQLRDTVQCCSQLWCERDEQDWCQTVYYTTNTHLRGPQGSASSVFHYTNWVMKERLHSCCVVILGKC